MTHHDHNHAQPPQRRRGAFSLSQHGVLTRLILASVLIVLIWAAVMALVL